MFLGQDYKVERRKISLAPTGLEHYQSRMTFSAAHGPVRARQRERLVGPRGSVEALPAVVDERAALVAADVHIGMIRCCCRDLEGDLITVVEILRTREGN